MILKGEIKKLYWNTKEVADQLGLHTETIMDYVKKYDLLVKRSRCRKAYKFTAVQIERLKLIERFHKSLFGDKGRTKIKKRVNLITWLNQAK